MDASMEPITLCLRETEAGWRIFMEDEPLFACSPFAEAVATARAVAAAQAEIHEAVTHIQVQWLGEIPVHLVTFAPPQAG